MKLDGKKVSHILSFQICCSYIMTDEADSLDIPITVTKSNALTKYIKTCTELSHPGCLLLQFYALNHVLIIYMQE